MNLTAVFIEIPEGGYNVFFEEFPWVTSRGGTLQEARENLRYTFESVMVANKDIIEQMSNEGRRIIKESYETEPVGDNFITFAYPPTARSLLAYAGTWEGDDLDECLEAVYATRQPIEWEEEENEVFTLSFPS